MADDNKGGSLTSTGATQKAKQADQTDNSQTEGQVDPNVTETADGQAAADAGITEGEFRQLRRDANVDASAGHQMDVFQYTNSAVGQEWLKGEKDRQKAEKEYEKEYNKQVDDDGLAPAVAKFHEVVGADKAVK